MSRTALQKLEIEVEEVEAIISYLKGYFNRRYVRKKNSCIGAMVKIRNLEREIDACEVELNSKDHILRKNLVERVASMDDWMSKIKCLIG